MSESAPVRVFGIVPAAGASRRMGRPKQLLDVRGTPMLQTVINTLLADASNRADERQDGAVGSLDGVVVVTSSSINAALQFSADSRFSTVINDDPETEMLASILLGVDAIKGSHQPDDRDAFLVCPGDMPNISGRTVRTCAREYRAHPGSIIIAVANKKNGHPIVVPFGLREDVQACRGEGLKKMLATHAELVRHVATDATTQTDIDTQTDYDALR